MSVRFRRSTAVLAASVIKRENEREQDPNAVAHAIKRSMAKAWDSTSARQSVVAAVQAAGNSLRPPVRKAMGQSKAKTDATFWRRYGFATEYGVRYGYLLTIFTFITTVLWIIDRLSTNVWPRESFNRECVANCTGSNSTGPKVYEGFKVFPSGRNPGSDGRKDLIEDGIKPGPWTVGLYDILARVSGRYLTASLNTLIWTMMHTTHFYFQECVFARKRWIDFGGTHEWLMWLHRKSGVLVGCALLPHIWSILLPCIFNGYGVQMREPSEFEWPLSEATMSGAPKDVDNDKKMMGLQYVQQRRPAGEKNICKHMTLCAAAVAHIFGPLDQLL